MDAYVSQNAQHYQALRRKAERVSVSFQRSPRKTVDRESRELDIPQPTLWRILRKRMRVKPYRLQLLQALTHDDKADRLQFYTETQQHLQEDGIAEKFTFNDEATFRLHGKTHMLQLSTFWIFRN
jgi:hypothetical protein